MKLNLYKFLLKQKNSKMNTAKVTETLILIAKCNVISLSIYKYKYIHLYVYLLEF